jgi:hypothetical protein
MFQRKWDTGVIPNGAYDGPGATREHQREQKQKTKVK